MAGEEGEERRKKRLLKGLLALFVGVLLLLTLFSNTMRSLTLPKVATESLAQGSFTYTLEGKGSLRPAAEANLMNPAGWKVASILVKEGDRVEKGQKLITYDSKSAERELQDEETRLARQKIDLQQIQDRYIIATQNGDALGIRSAKRDMEGHKLDERVQERKIQELTDKLRASRQLSAPFAGVITKLGAVEGLASGGEADVLITNHSRGYWFEFQADTSLLNQVEVMPGSKLSILIAANAADPPVTAEGIVTEIKKGEPRMESGAGDYADPRPVPQSTVVIKVEDNKLIGGEEASLKLTRAASTGGFLVASAALRKDRKGAYLTIIEEQRGPLGNDFIARKVPVTVTATNEQQAMIQSDSLYAGAMVIVESSEPLQDGNRVRLE